MGGSTFCSGCNGLACHVPMALLRKATPTHLHAHMQSGGGETDSVYKIGSYQGDRMQEDSSGG